jgi:hypothetical protein
MDNIFDLVKLKTLVDDKNPKCVIVIDTNIMMDNPDYSEWKTDFGDALWVISGVIADEIQKLKSCIDKETKRKADKARRSLSDLCQKGNLILGTSLGNGQSCISISNPSESILNKALKDYPGFRDVFGDADEKLYLLTKSIADLMLGIPVILCTADSGLFNKASTNGENAHLFSVADIFPLKLKKHEWVLREKTDWDAVLTKIEREIEETSVEIELTLVSKTLDESNPKSPFILAKGTGKVHGQKEIPFLWETPFSPITYIVHESEVEWACDTYANPSIDFGEQNINFNPDIVKTIKDQIVETTYSPTFNGIEVTLQDPSSITKQWLQQQLKEEALASLIKSSETDAELFASAFAILNEECDDFTYSNIIDYLLDTHHRFWHFGETYCFSWSSRYTNAPDI